MEMITTKKQAVKFCNRYVELVDKIIEFNDTYSGTISPCIPRQRACQMFSGLQKLAELLGLETYEKSYCITDGTEYNYLCFIYNDVEFFTLNREAKK